MQESKLLLISRDDIVKASNEKHGSEIFRLLAGLTRRNFHLLATAPQPERFVSSHGGPDDALLGPNSIRKKISDEGGVLDGVYYVPRSLLTQRRNRDQALQDMLQRYSAKANHCYLLSSSRKFVNAAIEIGIRGVHLDKNHLLLNELNILAKDLAK
ncbi:hypothetical protein ACFL1V_06970 [Pseudomonadota bacterium]